jgi:hypothetical protein
MECLGIGLTQCANHSSQQGRSPQQYTVDTTHGRQRKSGGTQGGNILPYSLRLKGLPPTQTSKGYQVWRLLHDMLQRASAVPVLGVYATENCLASGGRHCYAFIYVGNEDDGNRFIQDMATTRVDRELLTAEWSSSSRPKMLAIPHRLQAAGGTEISYWHPMQGEIPQTRPEGTVPQTQDGPPEPQNQQAQHCDPPINIHSTPGIVHTMMRNTVEKPRVGVQAGAIPAQQQGPACSSMVWDMTQQEEAGLSPPQGDKRQLAQQHSHSKNPEGPWHRSSTTKPYCSRVTSCS